MFAARMQGDSTEKEQGTYDNESLMIDSKWLRMIIAQKRGDSTEMERITSELISFFQKHHDELHLAKVYKEQASSFEDQGRYQEALDIYRMARDIYETIEAFEPLGRLEMEMGILYKNLNRFGDSLDHHRRAWDIFVANDMANEIELCRKNLLTTITKAAYQVTHLERDKRLWYYNKLINEGKIDELITKIEEGSDIWKRY
jgi:tetratricopeptide (TPR) repeat protein